MKETKEMYSSWGDDHDVRLGNVKICDLHDFKGHLMATSLGYFFRKYPEYFESLDALIINGGGVERFKQYMKSRPQDLNNYINNKILPESEYKDYRDFGWIDEMGGDDEKLSHLTSTILEMLKEFERAKQEALSQEKFADADYFARQIAAIHKEDVIKYLSNRHR